MSDFKKLHVWQKAHALSLCVDRVSKQIRGGRYASLRSQIFRAATSIPANIAEGRRQESEKEFARFLRYALLKSLAGSLQLQLPSTYQGETEADKKTRPVIRREYFSLRLRGGRPMVVQTADVRRRLDAGA